jgi:membrane-associated protease RseP (regulator of RpoE activity)
MKASAATSLGLALVWTFSQPALVLAQPAPAPSSGGGGAAGGWAIGVSVPAAGATPGAQTNTSTTPGQNENVVRWAYDPRQALTFNLIDEASRNSGMTLAPADPALQAHLGLGKNEGLIVTAIDPGSPAAAAGIHQNDVLVRLGDDESKSVALAKPADLEEGLRAAGDRSIALALLRVGKKITVKVQPRFKVSLGPVRPEPPAYWIGVSAGPVEPALRTQLLIPPGQGLIITEVYKDSPAVKAGIQPHDIFLNVDGVALSDSAALTKLVQSRGEKPMRVELLRQGRKQEIQVAPQRRTISIRYEVSGPKTGQFDFVLPGTLITSPQEAVHRQMQEALNRQALEQVVGQIDLLVTKQVEAKNQAHPAQGTTSTGKSIEQRLDDLSAQMKELRAAIQALSRAQEKK